MTSFGIVSSVVDFDSNLEDVLERIYLPSQHAYETYDFSPFWFATDKEKGEVKALQIDNKWYVHLNDFMAKYGDPPADDRFIRSVHINIKAKLDVEMSPIILLRLNT